MKVIDVPENAKEILDLLEQANQDELVLRTPDGTEYTLTVVDDFDEEIRRKAYRAVERMLAIG